MQKNSLNLPIMTERLGSLLYNDKLNRKNYNLENAALLRR